MEDQEGYIGLSFSLCIVDIVRGKVPLDKVKKIITGADISTKEGWQEYIHRLKKSGWFMAYIDIEECERVAWELINSGKVESPYGQGLKAITIRDGHWIYKGEKIVFPWDENVKPDRAPLQSKSGKWRNIRSFLHRFVSMLKSL